MTKKLLARCVMVWNILGMKIITCLIIVSVFFDFYKADICTEETIIYKTGQTITILDINAEDISGLQQVCYKQFNIPGSLSATLIPAELELGGNKYFTVGTLGMNKLLSRDTIHISQANCLSSLQFGSNWWEEMTKDKNIVIANSTAFCLRFQSAPEGKNLGTHFHGGRVILLLKVDVALCDNGIPTTSMRLNQHRGSCREICNATDVIVKCTSNTQTTPITLSTTNLHLPTLSNVSASSVLLSTTSSSTATTQVEPLGSTTVKQPSTQPGQTERETTLKLENTSPFQAASLLSTDYIHIYYTLYPASRSSGPGKVTAATHTTQFTTHKIEYNDTATTTSEGKLSTEQSNKSQTTGVSQFSMTMPETTTEKLAKTPSPTTNITIVTQDAITTTLDNNEEGIGSTVRSSMKTTIPTSLTSQGIKGKEPLKDGQLFGLVNGLYVLIGCILTILLILIVSCCIFRIRKYRINSHSGQDCNTVSSTQTMACSESYDMPWRDNWLVRHHSAQHHPSVNEDTLSQSEKDFQMIHGHFFHQSNPELHLIHREHGVSEEQHEAIYDNAHYLLKLKKNELDKKVKDVLIMQQRLQSISSNASDKKSDIKRGTLSESSVNSVEISNSDSNQRVQSFTSWDLDRRVKRRAKTISECSTSTLPDSDVFEFSSTIQQDQETRKCQRSSSSVEGSNSKNKHSPIIQRRRTLSQTTNLDTDMDDSIKITNYQQSNLNNVSFQSRTESEETQFNKLNQEHNNDFGKNISNIVQTEGNVIKDKLVKNVPSTNHGKDKDTNWTVNAFYALVSQQHGASGTMQFKK